jgi:hypothetical protein
MCEENGNNQITKNDRQRREDVNYNIGSPSPFEGDIIAYSREGTTPPPFKRHVGSP